MKGQDVKLTLRETEELCRLFMDCKLSVLEETELEYVLSNLDYHSPLIDEVRELMAVPISLGVTQPSKPASATKRTWAKRFSYFSVAASIALLIGIGFNLNRHDESSQFHSGAVYIAYAGGKQLNTEDAKKQVEEDILSADAFIREMEELEAQEVEMADNFINSHSNFIDSNSIEK